MKKTYSQIMDQIETLKKQAESVKSQEINGVIARIKEAIEFYGLTTQDLGLSGKRGKAAKTATAAAGGKRRGRKPKSVTAKASKSARAPKFRDEASGNVWSGRGPRPGWVKEALAAGRKLEEFAIGG